MQRQLAKWLHRYMPDRIKPLHELRKMVCALQLYHNGGDVLQAKACMRHGNIKTTMIYTSMIKKPKASPRHELLRACCPELQKIASRVKHSARGPPE